MLIRADDVADGQALRAEVCVVGAGPAGLSLAWCLAEGGVDVLLLEAADRDRPSDALETVRNTGLPYDVSAKRARGVGGSSHAWNLVTPLGDPFLRLRELDPLDLEPRPGVRDIGWPVPVHELRAGYRSAWDLFGMGGDTGTGGVSEPSGDTPAVATEDVGELRVFGYGPASTFTERLPQQLARHRSVRIVSGAVVTDVRTDQDAGVVSGLRVRTHEQRDLTVEATVYVLAGGGIENARLLLASRSRHPEGLGNSHDHVGRYFMEHPHYASAVVRPSDHRLDDDPSSWDVHEQGGRAVQRKHALSRAVLEREGLLSTAFYLVPHKVTAPVLTSRDGGLHPRRTTALRDLRVAVRERDLSMRTARTLRDALGALPSAGRFMAAQALAERAVRAGDPHRRRPRVMTVAAMAEQVPDPRSRVTLASDLDAFGVPVAQLDWRLTELDWWSMARSQELMSPYLSADLGARVDSLMELKPRPWVTGGAHHMSTTRMTSSPRDGVVDPDGRVHGVSNLFVTGTSVFPAGGSANPTLTVVALALRLGEHLRAQLARTSRSGLASVMAPRTGHSGSEGLSLAG